MSTGPVFVRGRLGPAPLRVPGAWRASPLPLRGLPCSLAKVSSQKPGTPGGRPPLQETLSFQGGQHGRRGAVGPGSAVFAPGEVPASGRSPLAAGPRPPHTSHLFIYNLSSACFPESSEALTEKLLPQAGLCSRQPRAPSTDTSPGLASSPGSARLPGPTGSDPQRRPLPPPLRCTLASRETLP